MPSLAFRRRVVVSISGQNRPPERCGEREPGAAPRRNHGEADLSPTRVGGLGLGLPLCQTLATAMDGHVVLRETSPAGTAFELELPAADTGHPS